MTERVPREVARDVGPATRSIRALVAALLVGTALVVSAAALAPRAGADEPEEATDALPAERLAEFAKDPAALAPIGVPSGETLPALDWSFSYRYSRVRYDDMMSGSSRKSTADVLAQFDGTPKHRDLEVHRFDVSFAPHERVTLAVAVPFVTQRTRMDTRANGKYATETSGVGDVEIRALVPFMRNGGQTLQVEMGVTAPSGSTGQRGRNVFGAQQRLPFPQQLGSGTVDLLPGLLYRGFDGSLSWGLFARGVVRLYDNSRSYREGDLYTVSPWIAHTWTDWMSTSVRMSWQRWQNVSSASRANQTNPERDPKRQGGNILEVGPGANFKLPWERAPRLGVEVTWPVWQKLNGPQLSRDWQLTTGVQWEF